MSNQTKRSSSGKTIKLKSTKSNRFRSKRSVIAQRRTRRSDTPVSSDARYMPAEKSQQPKSTKPGKVNTSLNTAGHTQRRPTPIAPTTAQNPVSKPKRTAQECLQKTNSLEKFPMDVLLLTSEVAQFFMVSTKTLANWRCKGCGPAFIKQGGLVRYEVSALKSFIEDGRMKTTNVKGGLL